MSYLDIAILTDVRKCEMSSRINELSARCQLAIANIRKLECQALTFTERLNCEPSKLKTRFLDSMRELDEYIDVMTEMNLTVQNFIDNSAETNTTPVLDINRMAIPLQPTPVNLLDMLSEPGPSTPTSSQYRSSERKHKSKLHKIESEERLIDFSSSSSSIESQVHKKIDDKQEQIENTDLNSLLHKVEKVMLNDLKDTILPVETTTQYRDSINMTQSVEPTIQPAVTLNLAELSQCALPPQEILQVDTVYTAYIFHVEDLSIWVLTEDPNDLFMEVFIKMEQYYNGRTDYVPAYMLEKLSYCVYYDGDKWFRCYILDPKYRKNKAQLYLVDVGKIRIVPNDKLHALYPEFCTQPPFARTCHLAGIDIEDQSLESLSNLMKFVSQFAGCKCQIEVEDNTSESVACYVRLEDYRTINHMLVENGLAVHIGGECTCDSVQENVRKLHAANQNEVDLAPPIEEIANCPEYEDALVAVTGYHNRDEAEICKNYKGPPHKTCFKGERCKKRHIPMHPDGWTLDRTEVVCKAPTLMLPPPGTTCTVRVTYVLHCNKVYVQFVTPHKPLRQQRFGVIMPPETLEELVRDMNSPAVLPTYRTLTMAPAPGELVAAVYPIDKKWYRARVLLHSPSDQTLQVQYVDYGTEYWVKESLVCELQPIYAKLPFQSVLCTMSEVKVRNQGPETLAQLRKYLTTLTQDKVHQALILSRSFDELEIMLVDKDGTNIAKKLAETGMVEYETRKVDVQDMAWKSGKIPPEI